MFGKSAKSAHIWLIKQQCHSTMVTSCFIMNKFDDFDTIQHRVITAYIYRY